MHTLASMSDEELGLLPDQELADRYWGAREELVNLRRGLRHGSTADRLDGGPFRRLRELDAVCEQLWRESRRRTQAGSIAPA